jgi:hypothetical protein
MMIGGGGGGGAGFVSAALPALATATSHAATMTGTYLVTPYPPKGYHWKYSIRYKPAGKSNIPVKIRRM